MTRIERVRAVLRGEAVDRPPFTAWYHFGLQHAPAERTAQAHLEFLEAYDLDWLKVMNDYAYPMPPGVDTVRSPADLEGLPRLDLDAGRPWMGEQLKVIERLARADVLIVDTVFSAWNTLRRNVAREAMPALMREHAEALERALEIVNEGLIRYARASVERGSAGIFLAAPASEEYVTRDEFERFMRPYDVALLEAVGGGFNVLHAHGDRLYLDGLLAYPAPVISWADRDAGPSIADMRRRTGRVLMGGISHDTFAYRSAAAIRAEVRDATAQAAGHPFLLAPGCSLPTYTFPDLIAAARDAARMPGTQYDIPEG